jgi:hypothetical protein
MEQGMRVNLPFFHCCGPSRDPVSAGRNEFVGRSRQMDILTGPAVIFRAKA